MEKPRIVGRRPAIISYGLIGIKLDHIICINRLNTLVEPTFDHSKLLSTRFLLFSGPEGGAKVTPANP